MPQAEIFQPVKYFETLSRHPAQLMEYVRVRAEALAEKSNMPLQKFRDWFDGIMETSGKAYLTAFYGKSVYGDKDEIPSDLDMMFFILDEKQLYADKRLHRLLYWSGGDVPRFAHTVQIWQNNNPIDNLSGWKRYIVAGTLLVTPTIDPAFRKAVEKARDELLENDFFVGGFGDILTYAVWKVLDGKEHQHIEPGNSGLLERAFFVPRDGCDFGSVPPAQFKADVRKTLAETFNESEMRILAKAAARRIKIKRSYRSEMAEKFVRNMRNRKIHL